MISFSVTVFILICLMLFIEIDIKVHSYLQAMIGRYRRNSYCTQRTRKT